MNQFQEELLQKKKSIIQNLQSTEISLMNTIKSNPRLWDEECLKFNLLYKSTLVLKADIFGRLESSRARIQQQKNEREAILLQIQKEQFQVRPIRFSLYRVTLYLKSLVILFEFNKGS